MTVIDMQWLHEAISVLFNHIADRLHKENITAYWVGNNLIRIDIKIEKQKPSSVGEVQNAEQI